MASRYSDQAITYQRELLSIFVEMQNELGKGMQDYVEHLCNQAASGFTRQADASTQTAAASVANPMIDLLSVWQTAFKEASSMAQRNMPNANSTFPNAIDAPTQQATRYIDATAGASRDTDQTFETSIVAAAVSDPNPSVSRANGPAISNLAAQAERTPGSASGGKKK